MRWEYFGTGLAFLGIGITMVLALPPPWWPKMPPSLVRFGLFCGLALIIFGGALTIMGIWPDALRARLWPILAMAAGIFIFVAACFWFASIEVKPRPSKAAPGAPDVTLKFVYPDYPALVLINNSEKTAQSIKWTVVLWNLDDPRSFSHNPNSPPNTHEPLPIPIQVFDFIRPHSAGGAQTLVGASQFAQFVKPGNRFVGSAGVSCPECERGRTYLVSFVIGQGGWFSEVADEKSGGVIIPPKLTKEMVLEYAKSIERTPLENRIPISGL